MTAKKKGIICDYEDGQTYGVTVNGQIHSGQEGLACGIESDLNAKLLKHNAESESVDVSDIYEVDISMRPGDIAQIKIKTYDGYIVCCALSSLKVTLNNMRASEFIKNKDFMGRK